MVPRPGPTVTLQVVTNLAANLLALALVVGIMWVSMVAMSAWFHKRAAEREDNDDLFTQAAREGAITLDDDEFAERRRDVPSAQEVAVPAGQKPCPQCSGSGASTERGRIQPCSACEGTGVS